MVLADMALTTLYTGIVRWVLVLLALYIVIRCVVSMMRLRIAPEALAYMRVEGSQYDEAKDEGYTTAVISRRENVIGREKSCDIQVADDAVSRDHALLVLSIDGQWKYRDLGSKNGSYIEDIQISDDEGMGNEITLKYGDCITVGRSTLTLMPVSCEERSRDKARRRAKTEILSAVPSMLALTLFQLLAALQLCIAADWEGWINILAFIGGLSLMMWVYVGIMRTFGQVSFEIEILAFLLSTMSLSVIASDNQDVLLKQFCAIALGLVLMVVCSWLLKNLERAKLMRWLMLVGGVVIMILNLTLGTVSNGAQNWIRIGEMSIQPSELAKVALIWIGAATLEELYEMKQSVMFMAFSGLFVASLGFVRDFGTAAVIFGTFLVIYFLRRGKAVTVALMAASAVTAMYLLVRLRPYVGARFETWGHAWDSEVINAAGYQQTRAMSGAASGGLLGVGAGNGWLKGIIAADTDMVFGVVTEEWGLIMSLLLVGIIVAFSVFAILSSVSGVSAFYTIAACGATTMMIFQTMLNVLGSMDILMFTGVTFPFVSNGGTSMMVSWIMLSFLKAADTRSRVMSSDGSVKTSYESAQRGGRRR